MKIALIRISISTFQMLPPLNLGVLSVYLEKHGIETVIIDALKYGLDMMKLGYTIDAVTVSQGRREQQSNGEYSNLIIVEIPNAWSEIVHLENYEKLPVTKFKKGSIVLLLDSMAVQFQDGMECMVDDKTYIFKNDKWLER